MRLNRNHFAASSLVAHWPLAGDSLNVLTGEKGEILSGATQTVTRTGRAYNFDGTANGIIKVGVNYLNTVLTNNFTVACFFTPNGANDLDDVILATGAGRTLFGVTATNQIIGRHYYGVEYKLTGATALTTGKTYFVVWTKSSVTGSRIYIDGVLDASNATSYYLQASDNYAGEHTAIGATPYGGAIYNKIAAKISDLSVFKSVLSDSEVRLLYADPWAIYEPDDIYLWGTAGGGGGVTIDCNLGTATASGFQATVSSNVTIGASLGTATASGFQATVSSAVTVNCALGSASASGFQATVSSGQTINAALGVATASGFSATISANQTINASLGVASAIGYPADISVGGAATINCNLGTATASGFAATVSSPITIAANLGTAAAGGYQAVIAEILQANLGTAVASGYQAIIVGSDVVNCFIGTANAIGYQADIVETTISRTFGIARAYKQEFTKRSNIQTSRR